MSKAPEEGQGPPAAVEPMVMMMTDPKYNEPNFRILASNYIWMYVRDSFTHHSL
jgi:hypothetical protein